MRRVSLGDSSAQDVLGDIAQAVARARRIVFITGAGISCSAGIPDFRSTGGLYNLAKQCGSNLVLKGQDLFDISLFRDPKTVELFYMFMAGLRQATDAAQPTPMHRFMKLIKDKGKLLRCYTQNIDGLEIRCGLPTSHLTSKQGTVVQLHGNIHMLHCSVCDYKSGWTQEYQSEFARGNAPSCPACEAMENARVVCGRRARGVGLLQPDVLLYGQEHPHGETIGRICAKDLRLKPDLVIVTGTSLKVCGLKNLVRDFSKAVKSQNGLMLFVNRTSVANTWNNFLDYQIEADADAWVEDLRSRIPRYFQVQSHIKLKVKPPLTPPQNFKIMKKSKEGDAKTESPTVSQLKSYVEIPEKIASSRYAPPSEQLIPSLKQEFCEEMSTQRVSERISDISRSVSLVTPPKEQFYISEEILSSIPSRENTLTDELAAFPDEVSILKRACSEKTLTDENFLYTKDSLPQMLFSHGRQLSSNLA